MRKELIEKLHNKLLKTVDETCQGVNFHKVSLHKVSENVFDMTVVAEGMVAAALFEATLPTKYSKSKIIYADKSSKMITYKNKPGCYEIKARMYLK